MDYFAILIQRKDRKLLLRCRKKYGNLHIILLFLEYFKSQYNRVDSDRDNLNSDYNIRAISSLDSFNSSNSNDKELV